MKKLLLSIVFALAILNVFGAVRYWVGGASANFNATSSWSASSGGASGASVPVSGDDVNFDGVTVLGTPNTTYTNATVYCTGSLSTLNSLNISNCNITFAIVPAATLTAATGAITTGSKTINLSSTSGVAAGQYVYVQSGEGSIYFSTTVSSFSANASVTLSAFPTAANTNNPSTLAFVSGTVSITTKTITLDNANVKSFFTVIVNGGVGNGSSTFDFSFLNNSTWTQCPLANGNSITLGNGGTFYMTGNSASNYFDGNSMGYITLNSTTNQTLYFSQNTIANNGGIGGPAVTAPTVAAWGSLSVTRGILTLANSVNTNRIVFGANSANYTQGIILNSNNTLNITGNGSSIFNFSNACQGINASASGSKVIITSNNSSNINALGRIFKDATQINSLEFNKSGSYFVTAFPLTVKDLTLTAGTINNSTANNITIVDGGSITRTAGKLLIPPIWGSDINHRVNINISGTCTSDNELLSASGSLGKIGTLSVSPSVTYTLNSPAIAPGYYLSAFNGGNGYGGTAPTPSLSGGNLASGTANTLSSASYNGYLYSLTSTVTGTYSSAPTITIPAPSVSAWAAGTPYTLNAVFSNSGSYYVCTTAGTSVPASPTAWQASTAYSVGNIVSKGGNAYICTTAGTSGTLASPSGTGTGIGDGTGSLKWSYYGTLTGPSGTTSYKDAITDGTAKWAYIGTSLTTATATLSMLPASITVDAVNISGKLSYPNSATPITLNVTNGLTINSGATLDLGTAQTTAVTHSINVGGSISNSGAITTTIANGKLDFSLNGNSAQTITSASSYNNLTINNTAGVTLGASTTVNGTLTLSSGTLTTTPGLTLGSGATISKSSGSLSAAPNNYGSSVNLIYNGAATKGNEFPGSDIINTLTVNNSAGITLNDNRNIPNLSIANGSSLSVNAGNQLTVGTSLANNGTLNLLSASEGTATILTPAIISGSGVTTVQQYLATARNWYISSPVTNANAPAGYTYYQRDEAGASWTSQPFVAGNQFVAGKGYIALPDATASTLTFTTEAGGKLNTADVDVELSWSGASAKGYNLIGNPYPCHLTWTKAFTDANVSLIEPTIYYRHNAGSVNNGGDAAWSFPTYNAFSGEATLSGSAIIPPMQAVWVKAKAAGTLTLSANLTRSHQTSNPLKTPATIMADRQRLRLEVSNGTTIDETLVYFDADATNGYDAYDSSKFPDSGASVQIYTTVGSDPLAINGMNSIPYDTEVPLGFSANQSGSDFSIRASQISNFDPSVSIYLKDYNDLLNTPVQLTADAAYTFSSGITSNNTGRFALIFKSPSVTTGINAEALGNVWVSNRNGQILLNGMTTGARLEVFNATGQKVISKSVTESAVLLNKNLPAGTYLLRVTASGSSVTKKIIID